MGVVRSPDDKERAAGQETIARHTMHLRTEDIGRKKEEPGQRWTLRKEDRKHLENERIRQEKPLSKQEKNWDGILVRRVVTIVAVAR